METLERVLAGHPFFEGLESGYLKLLVGCASNARFPEDAYLFREGEEAHQFYLIREGKIALQIYAPHCPPILVETLEQGDIVGFSWLLPPYTWRFDARVIEAVRAIALDGKCLRAKCDENHDLGFELLKRISHIMDQRLSATRLQLLDIYATRF